MIIKTHELKIERKYFERLQSGEKTCEIRFNDRDFQRGDHLRFLDADEKRLHDYQVETVFDEEFEITHVLNYPEGLKEGFVVLSLKNLKR